jgi:hypothetical protein
MQQSVPQEKTPRLLLTTKRIYSSANWLVASPLILILFSNSFAAILPASIGRFFDDFLFFFVVVSTTIFILVLRRFYLSPLYPGLIFFTLLVLLTSLINKVPSDILLLGLLSLTKPLLIFLVYQSVPLDSISSKRILRFLHKFFVFIVLFSVGYAVFFEGLLDFNIFPGDELHLQATRLGISASRSFFEHASHFSGVMTFLGYYFFCRYLLKIGKKRQNLLLFGFSILGLILGLRLKSLLFFPVGLVVIFLFVRFPSLHIKKRDLFFAAIVFLISGVSIGVIAYLFRDLLIFRLSPDTTSLRTILFRYAIFLNQETFGLGVGAGMFASPTSVHFHYSEIYYRFNIHLIRGGSPANPSFITDQWWAWYIGEAGIIGFLLFTSTIGYMFVLLTRISHHWLFKHPELSLLSFTSAAAVFYGIFTGFASLYLSAPPTGFLIMAVAGLCFALDRGLKHNKM